MAPGGLNAGEVYIDVGADVHDRGFREYDRLYAKAAALPDIEKTLSVKTDSRGLDIFDRAIRDTDRDANRAERSTRALSGTVGDLGRSANGGSGGLGKFNLQMGIMSGRAGNLARIGALLSPILMSLSGAAVAVAGSLAQAAAGAAALGAAGAASAIGGLPLLGGVLASLTKVGLAYKSQSDASNASTLAAGKAASTATTSAHALRDARERLTDAERSYADAVSAAKDKVVRAHQDQAAAARDLKQAEQDVSRARTQAAEDAAAAARTESDAAAKVVDAQRSVTEARLTAIAASREASRDARESGLNVQSAQLDLGDRGTELAKARGALSALAPTATDAERAAATEAVSRAEIAYSRAVIDLGRAKTAAADAQKKENDYRTQGLATFEPYRKALEDLKAAQDDARRATETRNKIDKQGIDRAPDVINAMNRMRDAVRKLAQARRDAAKLDRQGVAGDSGVQSAASGVRNARQSVAEARQTQAAGGVDPAAAAKADLAVQKLTDSERRLLDQLHKTGAVFKRDLGPAQDKVIGALAYGLKSTEPLMDRYKGQWTDLGDTISKQIHLFSDELDGPAWKARLDPIMNHLDDVAQDAGRAGRALAEIFFNIAAAATPELVKTTDGIAGGLERIADTTDDQKKMRAVIGDLMDDFRSWWQLIKDTGGLLVTVLHGGADDGRALVDSLDDVIKRWDHFLGTEEGQKKMHDFFRSSVNAVKDIVGFLKGVYDGLTGVLDVIKPVAHWLATIVDHLLGIDKGKGGIEKVGAVLGTMAALKFLGVTNMISGLLSLAKSGQLRDVLSKIPGLSKILGPKGAAGGVVDELTSRGGSPARPLYVFDVSGGLGGGKPGLLGPDGKPISSAEKAAEKGGVGTLKKFIVGGAAALTGTGGAVAITGGAVSGLTVKAGADKLNSERNTGKLRTILDNLFGDNPLSLVKPASTSITKSNLASVGLSIGDVDRLKGFRDEIDALAKQGNAKGIKSIAGQMRDLVNSLPDKTAAGGINSTKKALDGATKSVEDLAGTETPMERFNRKVREAKDALDKAKAATDGLRKGSDDYYTALTVVDLAEQNYGKTLQDRRKYVIANETPMEKANRTVRESRKALDDARDAQSKLKKGTDEYRDAVKTTTERQKDMKDALRDQRQAVRDAMRPFATLAGNVAGLGTVVADVAKSVGGNVNKVLGQLGAKTIEFAVDNPKPLGAALGNAANVVSGLLGLATGGVPNPGSGGADDHMLLDPSGRPVAMMSGTEGVLNNPQMGIVDHALQIAHSLGALPFDGLQSLWGSGMRHYEGGGILQRANYLDRQHYAYKWGGGHQYSGVMPTPPGPVDCSGAVSYVLGIPPRVSGALETYGQPGPGPVTIYANASHTFMKILDRYFGTSGFGHPAAGTGAAWFTQNPSASYLAGFVKRHVGLDGGGLGGIDAPKVTGPAGPLLNIARGAGSRMAKAGRTYVNRRLSRLDSRSGQPLRDGGYGIKALERLWVQAGGPGSVAHTAAAISRAEDTTGDPMARNASGATGLWQILGQVVPGVLTNPLVNARNAVKKYRDAGNSFRPWVTYTQGTYRKYLNRGGRMLPRFAGGGKLGGAIGAGVGAGAAAGSASQPGPSVYSKQISAAMTKVRRPIAGLTDDIEREESRFTAMETKYATDPEDLIIYGDKDHPATIDEKGLARRLTRIDKLVAQREKINKLIQRQIDAITRARKEIRKAIHKLRNAMKGAKGKDRRAYKKLIGDYQDALYDYGTDKLTSQGALKQGREDKQTLLDEKSGLAGSDGAGAGGTLEDIIGELDPEQGGPALPTDEIPPEDAQTPQEVIAAGLAALDAFNEQRQELYGSYGRNFAAAGADPFGSQAGRAAGLRYFGATTSGDPAGPPIEHAGNPGTAALTAARDGGGIHIEQNYAAPPADPLTWTADLKHELVAAT